MVTPKVFTVGQINRYIKNLLENDFILNSLLVQGEISNFKAHSSGHWYFTLKDAAGAISCVIFRQHAAEIPFLPENGMRVILYGSVSLYEKTGQYQLYGEFMEPIGVGALQLAFEQLKEKLSAEGLFDAEFKRELPKQIGCIAIVTSPTGAAVRDMIQIAKRRDPRVKIAVFPALVQGEQAAAEIAEAIRDANRWGQADVLIVGRGGGSIEDLWAFNEEVVARAIFASELPVISAVGHETDVTIADFAADLRAPTPSAAAELATIPLQEQIAELTALEERLWHEMQDILRQGKRWLDYLRERPILKRPLEGIERRKTALEEKERLLLREILLATEKKRVRLAALEARLAAVSPFSVMKRGYAMVLDTEGKPITTADAVKIEEEIQLVLRDGSLRARVTGKAVTADGESSEEETVF